MVAFKNMKNHCLFWLILLLTIPFTSLAQTDSLYEALSESVEEDDGLAEIFEELQQTQFNINSVSREDLRIFPFLTESQIDSILSSRPFIQKREVRKILNKETYNYLQPFFIVNPVPRIFTAQFTQRNNLPLYKVKGIEENKFRGDDFDNYSKIRFRYSESIAGGLLMQKDLGENEISDHVSGFLQWQNQNMKIILGSYQVQFGQGLILDSPYAQQKSVFTLAPLQTNNSGGRHYLSSSEYTGFNGLFVHYSPIENLSTNVFYANTLRDGNIDYSYQYVTGINTSGYHRTESEYNKKDLIREKMIGSSVLYDFSDNIQSGFCAATVKYNPPLIFNEATQSDNELRRSYYHFSGDRINLFSAFFHFYFESVEFSSEVSTNQFNKFSHSYNVLFPTSTGGVGVKWWQISKQFQSPFGHSFASGSNFPQAKQGFYVGLQQRINHEISCSSYWTSEKDLWRTYFNPMPTYRKDFLLNLNYKIADKTDLIFRYQFSDNNSYNSNFLTAFSEYRRKFRLDFLKQITKSIRVRSRVEKVFINYSDYLSKQQGINLYQDISWQVSPLLNIKARYSSFITDDYDSRIYEFENDIPGAFSNYALSGKGMKWYLLLKLNIFNDLLFWLKYRSIYYDGIETIGSGDLQSEGNSRQDIKLQFDFKY